MKNIDIGAHFFFLLILCSIKIERLLFLKFLKILAFFDSYFWPFYKSEEKIKVIFVISAIMLSIWNVFIKFLWHDALWMFRWICLNWFIDLFDRASCMIRLCSAQTSQEGIKYIRVAKVLLSWYLYCAFSAPCFSFR